MNLTEFLGSHQEGPLPTEDVLALMLPLLRQVVDSHSRQMVAPLNGIESIQTADSHAYFEDVNERPFQLSMKRIRETQRANRGTLEVVQRDRVSVQVDENDEPTLHTEGSLDVVESSETSALQHPIFVTGYVCWEQLLGHHDPLTDVFCLGQILAAASLGLDFHQIDDVQRFVKHRRNLFLINESVHPVIARAIVRMTELDRDRRAQDLPLLISALENYRQQDVEISVEASEIEGFESRDLQGKQQVLLDRLQKRLFDISKRNRLLHFRPSMQSVNLTHASVPLAFDFSKIRDSQITTCDARLQKQVASGKKISLNKRLNFAEALYLPSLLDGILRETRRDMAEYGFVQLRLVLCMLHWSNLKEKPHERFTSPLVLVPVQLKKKKGVRDSYELEPLSSEAEVNPVVRHQFKNLYDIQLPETIDLDSTDLNSLWDFMRQAISQSESAVELRKIDRPQIRLLHASAKRRLDKFRKQAESSGRGVRSFRDIEYSYDPANYHPLGIKVYSNYLKPHPLALSAEIKTAMPRPRQYVAPEDESNPAANTKRMPTANDLDSNAQESKPESKPPSSDQETVSSTTERSYFELQNPEDANPYDWAFDLCNVTLANFRYRRMSLVKDYESLVIKQPQNDAFESVFSLVPRPSTPETNPAPTLTDRYHVVPCDPTQAGSIAAARAGKSYIVQGPPGTGKSQTITNLIADFAARGKRILFVCEKRAAIDVVFARLRQCGLGELCCLIHDSQADKKSFVMDLKQTYEAFLQPASQDDLEAERQTKVTAVHNALQPLQEFSDVMNEVTYRAGVPTSELFERAIQLRKQQPQLPELSPLEQERLPTWRAWNQGRPAIENLVETLQRQISSDVLARHPLRNIRAEISSERPLQIVTEGIQQAESALGKLDEELNSLTLSTQQLSLQQLKRLGEYGRQVSTLAKADALGQMDPSSSIAQEMARRVEELEKKQAELKLVQQENSGWKKRIAKRDLDAAIDSANNLSKKWVPIVFPSWWRLRSVMKQHYDFQSHAVKPTWVAVLTRLKNEYALQSELDSTKTDIQKQFGLPDDLEKVLATLDQVKQESAEYPDYLGEIHKKLIVQDSGAKDAQGLSATLDSVRSLNATLDPFLVDYDTLRPADLQCELELIKQSLDQLPDFLTCLDQLQQIPDDVSSALRTLDLSPDQIETASAFRALEMIERDHLTFQRFDGAKRNDCVTRLQDTHQQWMDINAVYVRQQTRQGFLNHVHQSNEGTSSTDKSTNGDFPRIYRDGRKTLEHEFGKQMRYKSIRDLVSGDSGKVVKDLKPIWLMSPLSVSDTLPLGEQDFDVVIFDEASQITLEASIPSLFRANQAIIVGDEQQLPPTDFFTARKGQEELEIEFVHEGETVQYDLESNSLLNHAARNLESTMLGWHYRSRDEALISFSNWAFYEGRLLTIPEESIVTTDKPALVADSSESAVENASTMFERPISFHRMQHGVYHKRRNRSEADYIANLIREILLLQDGRTIGVIAFSEAQQAEIESAISRLAKDDPEFSAQLDAELVREDDGQFVGLLVKNLENIQGDERDVIILSVCYGPDEDGRMIMNFGPINKSGGEKRLNVAFSRAKHHMAIVSTIGHPAITNDYNRGANCLKNYLKYAESISTGDAKSAAAVLHAMAPWNTDSVKRDDVSPVLLDMAAKLAEHNLQCDFYVGRSEFRCDIGVKMEGDAKYRLGILVDVDGYYQLDVDLLDRELFRPRLLRIFGWDVYSVLVKDWLTDSDRIVNEIVSQCFSADQDKRNE